MRKYRVHLIEQERAFHVHYIYLNGRELHKTRIDHLRAAIMDSLAMGVSFEALAERHTMDGNKTGDWGWKSEKMAVAEFSSAVLARSAGEVFIVDIPSNDWFYVVRKDEPDMLTWTYVLHPLRER